MKIEDVRFGMKVVPHDKTAKGWSNFVEWRNSQKPCALFFSEHGFLYVKAYDEDENAFSLYTRQDGIGGDYFRASDFTPAEIEFGDEVRLECPCHSGEIGIVGCADQHSATIYLSGNRRILLCTDEIDLVRKAHCIKPEAAKANEPKAPEAVRLAWVQFYDPCDLRLYKVPAIAEVEAGDTVLTPPKCVKLRGVVEEVRTVSKADAAFMLRGQQPMLVPFLVGKVVTETKEVLFDD